ncbi:Y-family DNA polymerase [Collinsella ureilytica]|nr:DNA repair protein [Collinsella urealyticum]
MGTTQSYLCIDLKTFYASVECADRGLDPFTTNLVVADPTRGQSTICLAVSPAMKRLGVRNRCRVFEIPPSIRYITATPRMQRYMEVSAQIYGIYLEYLSPEDIHVYSVDECFIDASPYHGLYGSDTHQLARMLMDAVLSRTGVSAAAGIGENLFQAKVALDITAKHSPDGIGVLDHARFRSEIWPHRPLTDIWGIGRGIATRLARYHVFDLMSLAALDPAILYREFGVKADLLIAHAHGRESATIKDIQSWQPKASSLMSGQILIRDYSLDEARVVLREMVDTAVLDLVQRRQVAGGISLKAGYTWKGSAHHGLQSPSKAGGSQKLSGHTASFAELWPAFLQLFTHRVDPTCPIRRLAIGLYDLAPEAKADINLFTNVRALERERRLAHTVNDVKSRFGKNALLRGTSFRPGATGRERNEQIGGHRA